MAAENIRKVKILVLGDSGVGKSTLVHMICHKEVLSNPAWTAGCSVEVKLHDHGRTMSSSNSFFLEFWDIGGSPAHKKGRHVFYQQTNGIILVHDLTNKKSHKNLTKWLTEFHQSREGAGNGSGGGGGGGLRKTSRALLNESTGELDYDPEQFIDQDLPRLIVGTKLDQIPELGKQTSNMTSMPGAACINVDCTNGSHFTVASQQSLELNKFFDKVIDRRFYPYQQSQYHMGSGTSSTTGERHRMGHSKKL